MGNTGLTVENSPFEQFVTLWVVIDPIGTIPVFIAVTASLGASAHAAVAARAALVAAAILLGFLVPVCSSSTRSGSPCRPFRSRAA